MTQLLRTSRTVRILTLAVAGTAALAGCSAPLIGDAQTASPTATPSPTTSSTPDPDPYPTPDGSEQLVMPVDDILDWAKATVPTVGDAGYVTTYSGWLSQQTSPNYSVIDASLPAGDYRLTVACIGASALAATVTAGTQTDGALIGSHNVDCAADSTTTTFEIVAPSGGITTNLLLDSDPVVYAVAIQSVA
jgi:hypothetical protein